jgi:hypothetical protein
MRWANLSYSSWGAYIYILGLPGPHWGPLLYMYSAGDPVYKPGDGECAINEGCT